MKVSPSLLPILRSRMQGELLALVLLHPEREYRITELAADVGVTPTAVLREVDPPTWRNCPQLATAQVEAGQAPCPASRLSVAQFLDQAAQVVAVERRAVGEQVAGIA
jgi:hypothetical protein